MEKYGFGLSRKEVLQMVGDYVKQNKLITPFNNGMPRKDWFLAFRKRQGLSVKKPQGVDYATKTSIDPFIVFPYFDLLEKTIRELNLTDKPEAIWNLDETSFSKDPAKTKVVGAKSHAATRVISSPGRDNTTVLLGANAAGDKHHPLLSTTTTPYYISFGISDLVAVNIVIGRNETALTNLHVPGRRTYGNQAITSYIPRRRGNMEIKEIDNKIMKLFCSDFQPFRIGEDRGFRIG